MTPEREQQIKILFDAAYDLPPAERAAYLAGACGGDAELRAAVEKLLRASEEAGDFLAAPPAIFEEQPPPAVIGRRIGPYEILREIGRGGMATVFLAQNAAAELVAIKLVWPGVVSENVLQRFSQEQQILARLRHPNIARLLDGGVTAEGWHYLVMEYVDGLPINQFCQRRKFSVSERLRLFRIVGRAVQYAHQNLIIHRDLKPSNILVTLAGVPKLLDFGIAKILDPEVQRLTMTGMLPLTPEYASPEQVRGREVTTATDVYSLGVVLYELLTERKPYQLAAPLLHELTRAICEYEPTNPSQAISQSLLTTQSRMLRGDLDKIVLMALRKDPAARYQTVAQFDEDLHRLLNGEPVNARGNPPGYRLVKFVLRNKLSTALAVLLLLTLLTVLFVSLRQTRAAREQARTQRRQLYVAQLQQAQAAWQDNDPARAQELLAEWQPQAGEEDLRGFEWRYLQRLFHRESLLLQHAGWTNGGAFDPASRIVVGEDEYRAQYLWDAQTGRLREKYASRGPGTLLALPAQRRWLAQLSDKGEVVFYETVSGQARHRFADSAPGLYLLGHDAAGEQIITGNADGVLRVRNIATGEISGEIKCGVGRARHASVATAAGRLLLQPDDKSLQLWNLREQRLVEEFRAERPLATALLPGEKQFLLSDGATVTLHEVETGRVLSRLVNAAPASRYTAHNGKILVQTWAEERVVRLYELPSFRQLGVFTGHTDSINDAHLAPDGRVLATASVDRSIRLWDAATAKLLTVIRGHTNNVNSARFSPDGRWLVTSSRDRTVRVWELAALLARDELAGHNDKVFAVAFAPDGKTLATASEDRTVKFWETASGQLLRTLTGHAGPVYAVAFSPDGRWLATGSRDRTVKLWDAATGQLSRTLLADEADGGREAVRAVAFSPDGALLVSGGHDDTVKLWEVSSGQLRRTLAGHSADVLSAAFSPDGRVLAAASWDKTVKLWQIESGRELLALRGHEQPVWSVKFSPDGRRLATGSMDNTTKLWDARTGGEQRTFKGHSDEVFSVAFAPDGQRLATASNDQTVRLWNVDTGEEMLRLNGHSEQVWSVAFAPDGRALASGGWDRTARLWRAP